MHDETRVVVFGTRHINAERPLFPGQKPVHEEWHRGKCLRWYSTGKLEEARSAGYEMYVVSIRPVFGPQDRWWRDLVPRSCVYSTSGVGAFQGEGDPTAWVFAPWRCLFTRLGVPWDERFDDFEDPLGHLVREGHVLSGDHFTGHCTLN